MACNVLQEYEPQLSEIFLYFSGKKNFVKNNKMDGTIQVHQFIELLTKANLLNEKTTDLKLEEVIFMIEKYYDPEHTLQTKFSEENF